MEDVLLLENPRRRRRRRAAPRRRATPRKRTTRRRRRRRNPANPVAALANPRRRRRSRRRSSVRRRRRSSSSSYGGRLLNPGRIMRVVTDAGGLAVAELLGDLGARALVKKTPLADVLRRWVSDDEAARAWAQLGLGVFAGPMLKRMLPRAVAKHWEIANVASALISLTYNFRQQAYDATGLADWVTSGPPAPAIAAPAATPAALSDWDSVAAGAASYTGDPFSM